VPRRDIIVIGASAGGFDPLLRLVGSLPASMPAVVLVALHTSAHNPGFLPQMLSRAGRMSARFAADGDALRHGEILVAPADHHLLVDGAHVSVTRGPRENGFRPAIDALFRTAAAQQGPRVAGVILSGALTDGTYGLLCIKHRGGIAIVQRVEEALVRSMPLSAIRAVEVDHIVGVEEMGPLLVRLAREPVSDGGRPMARKGAKHDVAERGTHALHANELTGSPSAFTCPDCGGALWELTNGDLIRYRCHVGHGYTAESLANGQHDGIEVALWTAVRTLEEHAQLHRRLRDDANDRGLEAIARGYAERARSVEEQANSVRALLMREPGTVRAEAPGERPAARRSGRRARRTPRRAGAR
jgi:two-component system chemotaxis response regulator CheB